MWTEKWKKNPYSEPVTQLESRFSISESNERIFSKFAGISSYLIVDKKVICSFIITSIRL